jgi:hypothetical protein
MVLISDGTVCDKGLSQLSLFLQSVQLQACQNIPHNKELKLRTL